MNKNNGYIGWSKSVRASLAEGEFKFPKTTFKRLFKVDPSELIKGREWHHTSKFCNKTYYYSAAEYLEKLLERGWSVEFETFSKSKYFFEVFSFFAENQLLIDIDFVDEEEVSRMKSKGVDHFSRWIYTLKEKEDRENELIEWLQEQDEEVMFLEKKEDACRKEWLELRLSLKNAMRDFQARKKKIIEELANLKHSDTRVRRRGKISAAFRELVDGDPDITNLKKEIAKREDSLQKCTKEKRAKINGKLAKKRRYKKTH